MSREKGNLSKLFKCCLVSGTLSPLSAFLAGIHMYSLHWLTTVFSAHHFGCELCTGRHWKGAFDLCCKISGLSFINCCAVAEFCIVFNTYNDKSRSCLATSIHVWVLLLEQCFVTVMDALSWFFFTCSVTTSHSYWCSFPVLQWSPVLLWRDWNWPSRGCPSMSVIEGRLIRGSVV